MSASKVWTGLAAITILTPSRRTSESRSRSSLAKISLTEVSGGRLKGTTPFVGHGMGGGVRAGVPMSFT